MVYISLKVIIEEPSHEKYIKWTVISLIVGLFHT
jgi:hypothetical protein